MRRTTLVERFHSLLSSHLNSKSVENSNEELFSQKLKPLIIRSSILNLLGVGQPNLAVPANQFLYGHCYLEILKKYDQNQSKHS